MSLSGGLRARENVSGLPPGISYRRRPYRCGNCRNCKREEAPVQEHEGRGRQPRRSLRGYLVIPPPRVQIRGGHPGKALLGVRPARKRRTYRADYDLVGEDVLITARGPSGSWRRHLLARGRKACRDHRRKRLPFTPREGNLPGGRTGKRYEGKPEGRMQELHICEGFDGVS